jgi:hypothetical protein
MPAQTVIKLRRGTASEWTSANPILSAGELGIEVDTNSFKFGNGTLAWSALPYTGGSAFAGSVSWGNVLGKPLVEVSGDDVDGGLSEAWYTWKDLKIDNGNASTVILDGVYANGGSAVN